MGCDEDDAVLFLDDSQQGSSGKWLCLSGGVEINSLSSWCFSVDLATYYFV